MYLKRTLEKKLKEANEFFKVIILTGPRQVGKTTLLEKIKEDSRTYVTLDDMDALLLATEDPVLFFEKFKPPVLIDEVQKAPNLFIYIKSIVDKSNQTAQFWLTGSQQFHLMKNVSESLAGRAAIINLQGFSISELQKDTTRDSFIPDIDLQTKRPIFSTSEIFEKIVNGSYPQLADGTPKDLFYSSYIKTYIEKDIREIINISNENNFLKFLRVIASRTAQTINYNDIANDVGISPNTVKSWISVLETSGLIYLLQPYFNNFTKRAIKTPKLYFLDTGLCSYLIGIKNADVAEQTSINGALFETYVVSEILKSYWHNAKTPWIYFYRDTLGKEIDLLIEENSKIYPIEIKKTSTPTKKNG